MKKQIITAVLLTAMVGTLCGCGSEPVTTTTVSTTVESSDTSEETTTTSEETTTVEETTTTSEETTTVEETTEDITVITENTTEIETPTNNTFVETQPPIEEPVIETVVIVETVMVTPTPTPTPEPKPVIYHDLYWSLSNDGSPYDGDAFPNAVAGCIDDLGDNSCIYPEFVVDWGTPVNAGDVWTVILWDDLYYNQVGTMYVYFTE